MSFKDKNIIVTGSNRGLGRVAVEAFAATGANVCSVSYLTVRD